MKKIIRGRVYDTSSAAPKAIWRTHDAEVSVHYICETLYQKHSGEFFLHCVGGAGTEYAETTSYGERVHGERIIPLTLDEADAWKKAHPDAVAIMREPKARKASTCLYTTHEQMRIIKDRAARAGLSVTQYIIKKCTE